MIAMPMMLVGGFFGNQGTMPFYLEAFSHVSPIHYAFNNLAQLQLGNSEYPQQKAFLEFLDIKRDYWFGIMLLGILIICF